MRQQAPDIVVASQLGTARYVSEELDLPSIFEELQFGVAHDAWVNATSPLLRWRRALTWNKSRRYHRKLVNRFDACTVVSERERALFHQVAPDYGEIHVIPNGVDLASLQAISVKPQPNTLIYNGALTYSANLDAMHCFLESIFPLVRAQVPEAQLKITGSTQGVNTTGLPLGDHVTLTGYLPDIRPAVAGAWACVVPLRVGGGTRLKILEAMALGTPVVATSKGAEGLDVQNEKHLLLADTPEEFAAAVVRLLREPGLRDSLSGQARRLVAERYNWSVISPRFMDLVTRVARQSNLEPKVCPLPLRNAPPSIGIPKGPGK